MTEDFDLHAALGRIKLLAMDFDGVHSTNSVYVGDDGVTEVVCCWRGDGIGLAAVRAIGIATVVLSQEMAPVVAARCKKLGVECYSGVNDKASLLTNLAAGCAITADRIAYIGNDVNDAECLKAVGLPIVVADAHPDVLPLARYVTASRGGRGAVREVCDLICKVQGAK